MPPTVARDLAGLRPATYNPRQISTRQREALTKSYLEFGDLSGIVVNARTNNIVGGHQRTDVFRHRQTRIVKQPHRDAAGTVSIGHVVVPTTNGGSMRIPYREVDWERDREMAANVAANSGGGDWDEVKLGKVMDHLQRRRFPIESIPLDALDIKKSMRAFESEQKRSAHHAFAGDGDDDGDGAGFALIDPAALKAAAQHMCPSCGYAWDGATTPSFGELHRLTPDNPARVLADQLGRSVRQRMKKTGENPVAAGMAVTAARIAAVRAGKMAGGYQPPPPAPHEVSDGRGRVRRGAVRRAAPETSPRGRCS